MLTRKEPRLVVIADQDPSSARFITRCLRSSGYDIVHCETRDRLVELEARRNPDVVLLDELIEGCTEAVRSIREASTVPIVLLTLGGNELAGILRCGADTILSKPFSSDLLLAYIEASIRRVCLQANGERTDRYVFGDFSVDFVARIVTRCGDHVHLTALEFRLLEALAHHAGRILTHQQLLRLVWGDGYEDSDELLRAYIRNLRRRLSDNAKDPTLILTERQIGYWMPKPSESKSKTN
jgi:two-component system KDP operon response regulator KdpE